MKFQKKYKTFNTVESCKIASIINALEYVVDEYYLDYLDVLKIENSTLKIAVHPLEHVEELKDDVVDRLYGEYWNVEVEHVNPLTISVEEPILGDNFKTLYFKFRDITYTTLYPVLKNLAIKTGTSKIEYFAALYDGELVVLEGEREKVTLPSVKAYATAHTHPSRNCIFSWKDVESALDSFSKIGILTGVIAEECSVLLYRTGLFTLKEYETLLDFRDKIRKGEILEALKTIEKCKNLSLEFRR